MLKKTLQKIAKSARGFWPPHQKKIIQVQPESEKNFMP